MPLRVLVVDDSPFMRGALVRMIEMDADFRVVDVAATGEEGVEKARRLRPDVVTLDVDMPGMGGLEALRIMVAEVGVPVIMVSASTEADAAVTLEALACGAVDFVPKALRDGARSIFKGAGLLHDKLRVAVEAGRNTAQAVSPPEKVPAPRRRAVQVVVVGSSTGGPNALQQVLEAWRPTVPVVVAQHMPPLFTTVMAKRLSAVCGMAVKEARNGDRLEAGVVLLAPGGLQMRVGKGGVVQVAPDRGESLYRPSVDILAASVAEVYGAKAVGVMLTGMGVDGLAGFAALKRKGAHIVAQDQRSCVVFGMPKAVAEAGLADGVVGISEMGRYLKQVAG